MKFNRFILALIALAVLAIAAQSALAQKSGLYNIVSGGVLPTLTTNQIVTSGVTNQAGSTTSYTPTGSTFVQTVAEYDNVGLTWSFTFPTGSTNGVAHLSVYKSFDNGQTYEVNPSFTYVPTPTAALAPGTWTTNTSLSVAGVTHLAFSLDNNTVGFISNVVLRVNLKSPKYGAKASTQ